MALEIERKYIDVEMDPLRKRLMDAGAKCEEEAHFESNLVFDTADRKLFATGRLLRLRMQEWPQRTRFVLTAKMASANQAANIKIRQEEETEIADGPTMKAILEQLGYLAVARYEKVRESWHLQGKYGAAIIDMDTLPFGNVVEIECQAEAMDAVASMLGLSAYMASAETYYDLGKKWQISRGMSPESDLVFEESQKKHIRTNLGIPNSDSSAYL